MNQEWMSPSVLSPGWIFWLYPKDTPYILFKLQEKEGDEAVSLREYILRLFGRE